MDALRVDLASLQPLDAEMVNVHIPSFVAEALGMEPCVFSLWSTVPYLTLIVLFLSLFIRLRGQILVSYYSKPGRLAPTRYVHFSPIPYESIVALLLSLPRAYGLVNRALAEVSFEDVTDEIVATSWIHWFLVAYIFVLDIFERYQWKNKTLKSFYTNRARAAEAANETLWQTKETLEAARQTTSADDVEKFSDSETEPVAPRSLYRRVLAALTGTRKWQLTAMNIAVSYQLYAFSKILCATVFLLNTSTFSCVASRAFGGDFGSTIPWAIITCIAAFRGVEMMAEGYRFAKAEILSS